MIVVYMDRRLGIPANPARLVIDLLEFFQRDRKRVADAVMGSTCTPRIDRKGATVDPAYRVEPLKRFKLLYRGKPSLCLLVVGCTKPISAMNTFAQGDGAIPDRFLVSHTLSVARIN